MFEQQLVKCDSAKFFAHTYRLIRIEFPSVVWQAQMQKRLIYF